jgi:hypothetical protein
MSYFEIAFLTVAIILGVSILQAIVDKIVGFFQDVMFFADSDDDL